MISFKELIKDINVNDIPHNHLLRLDSLLATLNVIRAAFGKPMTITSGYRRLQDHLRIYSEKGITDKSKIPMGSKHLSGEAADVYDPSGEFYQWCKDNDDLLRANGVFLEERQGNWQHIQISPFRSYNGKTIWFNP